VLAHAAKAAAEAAAGAAHAKLAARPRDAAATGQTAQGRAPPVPAPPQARPAATAPRTFPAPDSRIMQDGARTAFAPASTAPAAVARQAQSIVAAAVPPEAHDKQHLVPRRGAGQDTLGQWPEQASAETGFCSEAHLPAKAGEGGDWSVPPARRPHPAPDAVAPAAAPVEGSGREQRRHKLNPPAGQAVYQLRKASVAPVCGQRKEGRGFRRCSCRGWAQGAAEWPLMCRTPTRLKLLRGRTGVLAA